VPEGFHLVTVAVAGTASPTAAGANPVSRDVVSLAYRRGFDQLILTTRRRGPAGARWRDPFAIEGVRLHASATPLARGALAGAPTTLVLDPRTPPHLWALTRALVVTVSGDLGRADLLRIGSSLRRQR